MPFVSPEEARNAVLVDLLEEAVGRGAGTWRSALVGDPTIRAVLLNFPPGFRTVPHQHPRATELFLVQSGRLGFRLDGEPEIEAGPGSFLTALPGQMHGLRTVGTEDVRLVAIVGPNLDEPDEAVEDREVWPDWAAALGEEPSGA